jgi:3-carboxy-cis,cis-muconate cycloisomerase
LRGQILTPLLRDPEIDRLLGDAALARAMVEVERALATVQGRLGVIEPAAAAAIAMALERHEPDLDDLARGTAAAGVPVPALVTQLRAAVGAGAAGLVHWGATSQDILDTALVLQLREVLAVLEARLDRLMAALAELAERHRATPMLARTRFQQAVPTLFGLKVAGWLAPLPRHRRRLHELRPRLLRLQLGGAAGSLAVLGADGLAVMEALAAELQLGCPLMPWHSQRDALVELGAWLALVAGSLGKLGLDVLLLAQNEIGEVQEATGGGSSTMPQKSNPVRAEALVSLARETATRAGGLHQAQLHAQERDGTAWQLEWTLLPGLVSATARALELADELARTLVIDAARMRTAVEAPPAVHLAEAASFALARHLPRAEAQALVATACRAALDSGVDLLDLVADRTTVPIDWPAVRAAALQPPTAQRLIDRVLRSARGEVEA